MKLRNYSYLALLGGMALSLSSCDKDENLVSNGGNNSGNGESGRQFYNVVVGINVTDNGSTYTAAYRDISSPDMHISFNNWGFEVPSVRTSYVYPSDAGDVLYNLSWCGGTVS